MTKAEKEKKKLNDQKLEALKAAGFEVGTKGEVVEGERKKVVYTNKKKPVKKAEKIEEVAAPVVEKQKEWTKVMMTTTTTMMMTGKLLLIKIDKLAAKLNEKVKVATEAALKI